MLELASKILSALRLSVSLWSSEQKVASLAGIEEQSHILPSAVADGTHIQEEGPSKSAFAVARFTGTEWIRPFGGILKFTYFNRILLLPCFKFSNIFAAAPFIDGPCCPSTLLNPSFASSLLSSCSSYRCPPSLQSCMGHPSLHHPL